MKPMFEDYHCVEDYEKDGLKFISPMLAKELEDEAKQDECFNSADYYIEEKFDGTRATLHFLNGHVRCFSRRVSEKTKWLCENSDSVPHIRDLNIPELEGTIIDGEMFIPNRPFKDVASTLNCKWDKAIARQEELGKIVFHAFDILYYKGIRVEMLPLHRRKVYLRKVIDAVNSAYIEMVKFYSCDATIPVKVGEDLKIKLPYLKDSYPTLVSDLVKSSFVTPRGYYEYIVATGGEGVILKPKNGKYYQKRGWEYTKIKKLLTKDVVIMGFTDPTDDYKGKFPTVDKWDYWETTDGDIVDLSECTRVQRASFGLNFYPDKCRPVSKFYAKGWVGNIRFGVVVEDYEMGMLRKKYKKFKEFHFEIMNLEGNECFVLEVGECSGFDEDVRAYLTENAENMVGSVIEVKANEIFKDTGKLRHPRYYRLRTDRSPLSCTFKSHINLD